LGRTNDSRVQGARFQPARISLDRAAERWQTSDLTSPGITSLKRQSGFRGRFQSSITAMVSTPTTARVELVGRPSGVSRDRSSRPGHPPIILTTRPIKTADTGDSITRILLAPFVPPVRWVQGVFPLTDHHELVGRRLSKLHMAGSALRPSPTAPVMDNPAAKDRPPGSPRTSGRPPAACPRRKAGPPAVSLGGDPNRLTRKVW